MSGEFEIILSTKMKAKLSHGGFYYVKDKYVPPSTYWKCEDFQKSKCKGRAMTRGDSIDLRGEHNHPGQPEKLEVKKLLADIKNKGKLSTETPHKIFSDALGPASVSAIANLPSITDMKRTVRRSRSKENAFPTLPNNREDLILPDEFKIVANHIPDSWPASGFQSSGDDVEQPPTPPWFLADLETEEEGSFFPPTFVPPPPRPFFLEDVATDGVTTCDLCSWAWQGGDYRGSIGMSWALTLVIVSLISALVGAIVMIVFLHCRRMKNSSGNETDHGISLNQRPPLNTPDDKEISTITPSNFPHMPQNFTSISHPNGVWSWLVKKSNVQPSNLNNPPGNPAENHYTHMEDQYNVEEALYAELDKDSDTQGNERDPGYQNSAYADPDAPPSTAPSSAYYSDLSVTTVPERAYEVVGLATLQHWDGRGNNDTQNRTCVQNMPNRVQSGCCVQNRSFGNVRNFMELKPIHPAQCGNVMELKNCHVGQIFRNCGNVREPNVIFSQNFSDSARSEQCGNCFRSEQLEQLDNQIENCRDAQTILELRADKLENSIPNVRLESINENNVNSVPSDYV